MDVNEYYLVCEDSLEGIFTGVYDAYLLKKPHEQIHICVGEDENYRLFAEYLNCTPDETKVAKVARDYYNSMNKLNCVAPQFYDSKK